MRILVANDDGIAAPGLTALVKALAALGEVYVAAPSGNRSGYSHRLTMDTPLWVHPAAVEGAAAAWAIDGSPADCVLLALQNLLPQPVDMVVSGINRGGNFASDCLYSGTVAAALEAGMRGLPAMAVSLRRPGDYTACAAVAARLVPYLAAQHRPLVLNVNLPPLPLDKIKGVKLCPIDAVLDYSSAPVYAAAEKRPDGSACFNFVPGSPSTDRYDSADHAAVRAGYISVTPLTWFWTHRDEMTALSADFAGDWGPLAGMAGTQKKEAACVR